MRSAGVEPNAENATEAELLVAMEAVPNKRSYRRRAAVRALLMGFARSQVAELFGRSERKSAGHNRPMKLSISR